MKFDPQILAAIKLKAREHNVELELLAAFVAVESAGRTFATRFESQSGRYTSAINQWAFQTSVTVATETMGQMMSWGLMQVMGFKAREMGFGVLFPELCQPEIGLEFGICVLKDMQIRFPEIPAPSGTGTAMGFSEALACAYNHGTPKQSADGKWVVQDYVNRVSLFYKTFKS